MHQCYADVMHAPLISKLLNAIQRGGNRLPDPVVVFIYLALAVLLLSWLLSTLQVSALHPITQEQLVVNNLLNTEGIQKIVGQAVQNFVRFAPVGVVLVVMLGIGIAEHSGLIAALVKKLVSFSGEKHLAYWISFAGVLSSLGADVGYVVLIPLAGIIYYRSNRPPLAGIAVAFAAVSAGFSANLFLGPVDVMLAGISTSAAQIVDTQAGVQASDNYYFIICSTFLITIICGWLSNNVVEPRLGNSDLADQLDKDIEQGNETSKATLWPIGLFSIAYLIILVVSTLHSSGPFYAEGLASEAGQTENSKTLSLLLKNIVPLLAFYFAVSGYIFGRSNGVYRSLSDSVDGMTQAMQTMAYYLVLMFFAAQFVNYFGWSNIGIIMAIGGAEILNQLAMPPGITLVMMIFIAAFINLMIGSASAKWTLLAPVFIPMLMLLNISPEQTQMAYRIGDSSTNIITPLMPYFGIVLAYAQHYRKQLGLGDIIATMLPYSFALLISWSLLLLVWLNFDLPLGPL